MTSTNFKAGDLVIWNDDFLHNSSHKEYLYRSYGTYIYQIKSYKSHSSGLSLVVPGTNQVIKDHPDESDNRRWNPDCFVFYSHPHCLLRSKKFII